MQQQQAKQSPTGFYGSSDVPYVSVQQAAHILRMSAWTLYRNMDQIPHIKVGDAFRIPVEWLYMSPPPVVVQGVSHTVRYYWQEELPLDFKDVRRWRNGQRPVMHDPFGDPCKGF